MDAYSSPYIIPNNSLHNPFPHSLLRTRQNKQALPLEVLLDDLAGITDPEPCLESSYNNKMIRQ